MEKQNPFDQFDNEQDKIGVFRASPPLSVQQKMKGISIEFPNMNDEEEQVEPPIEPEAPVTTGQQQIPQQNQESNPFDQFDGDNDTIGISPMASPNTEQTQTVDNPEQTQLSRPVTPTPKTALQSNLEEEPTFNFDDVKWMDYLPSGSRSILGGVYNAPRNLIQGALAAGDWLEEKFPTGTGSPGSRAQEFGQMVPRYESSTTGGKLLSEGVSMLAGGMAGAKAAEGMVRLAPKTMQGIIKVLSTEAGAAGAVSPTTEGLFIGDDATWQVLAGLGTDNEGHFSENLLNKKLNLLAEGAVLSGVVNKAVQGSVGAFNIVNDYVLKPISKVASDDHVGKTIVRDMIASLQNVGPGSKPDDIADNIKKIYEHVERGKLKEPISAGELGEVNAKRDTMTAMQRGLDEASNVTDEERIFKKNIARGIRNSGNDRSFGRVETTEQMPRYETQRLLEQGKARAGGEKASRDTMETIQEEGLREAHQLSADVGKAKEAVIKSEKDVGDLIANDPTFGGKLKRLGDRVNLRVGELRRDKADEVISFVNEADKIMTKEKNDLFDAIPEGAEVNPETLADAIEGAVDVLPTDIVRKIGEAGTDFKKLNRIANFELADEISKARGNKEFQKANALVAFKRHITDDQLDYLASSGRDDVKEAAERARDYYKNEYAPFWRDGILEEIQNLNRTASPAEKFVEQRQTFSSTVSNPEKREYTQKVVDLLNREEAGKNAQSVADYAMLELAEDANSSLAKNGKLLPEDIERLQKKVEAFVPAFDKVDPTQVNRLEDFMTNLRDKRFTTEELKEQLDNTIKNSEAGMERLKKEYGDFFTEDFTPKQEVKSTYDSIFDKALSTGVKDSNLINTINIARRTGKMNGIKASYLDYLNNKLFKNGTLELNPMKKEEVEKLLAIGDEIYDDPEVMYGIGKVLDEISYVTSQGTGKKVPLFQPAHISKDARGAIDMIITQAFGALNRVGARLRSGAGRALSKFDKNETFRYMTGKILDNPDEFVNYAKQLEKEMRYQKFLPKETSAWVRRFFGIQGALNLRDNQVEKENDFEPIDREEDRNPSDGRLSPSDQMREVFPDE